MESGRKLSQLGKNVRGEQERVGVPLGQRGGQHGVRAARSSQLSSVRCERGSRTHLQPWRCGVGCSGLLLALCFPPEAAGSRERGSASPRGLSPFDQRVLHTYLYAGCMHVLLAGCVTGQRLSPWGCTALRGCADVCCFPPSYCSHGLSAGRCSPAPARPHPTAARSSPRAHAAGGSLLRADVSRGRNCFFG